MASMEDVSIENIVILSDEDEEDGPKMKKRKSKKAEKMGEKLGKKKDKQQEIPEKVGKKKDGMQEALVSKDSPKPKKVRSPQKKTATPKKQGIVTGVLNNTCCICIHFNICLLQVLLKYYNIYVAA